VVKKNHIRYIIKRFCLVKLSNREDLTRIRKRRTISVEYIGMHIIFNVYNNIIGSPIKLRPDGWFWLVKLFEPACQADWCFDLELSIRVVIVTKYRSN